MSEHMGSVWARVQESEPLDSMSAQTKSTGGWGDRWPELEASEELAWNSWQRKATRWPIRWGMQLSYGYNGTSCSGAISGRKGPAPPPALSECRQLIHCPRPAHLLFWGIRSTEEAKRLSGLSVVSMVCKTQLPCVYKSKVVEPLPHSFSAEK